MAVYFARADEDGPVKIGFATDVRRRLTMLRTSSERDIKIVRLLDGDRALEKSIHESLFSFRLAREWFALSEECVAADYGAQDLPFQEYNVRKCRGHRPSSNQPLSAIERAIEKAGGVTKLAKGIGDIHYSSILGWKKTGIIPSKRLLAVSKLTGISVGQLLGAQEVRSAVVASNAED